MTRRVTAPKVGQPIRASFLDKVASNQNEMLEYLTKPRDLTGGEASADGVDQVQGERGKRGRRGPQGEPGEGLNLVENWREVSRRTTTVRITSDSDDSVYVDVERIRNITFSRPGGGVITLRLDND